MRKRIGKMNEGLKLAIGNGSTVEFRDVGKPVYRMVAKSPYAIPLHGFRIMTDKEARKFIEANRAIAIGKAQA